MRIENQVCTQEQALRFKELGIEVRSNLYWQKGEVVNMGWGNNFMSAFTVAELGLMLPDEINGDSFYTLWVDDRFGEPGRQFTTSILNADMQQGWETEAEARAAMLIYLLENNLTTAEEVNNRLNQ